MLNKGEKKMLNKAEVLNALYNAIVMLEEVGSYNSKDPELLEGLGITEEEYDEIMGL